MIHTEKVKALAFDFGGTLDSPFMHWMKIYLKLYGIYRLRERISETLMCMPNR